MTDDIDRFYGPPAPSPTPSERTDRGMIETVLRGCRRRLVADVDPALEQQVFHVPQ